jgi:hypothetical protein
LRLLDLEAVMRTQREEVRSCFRGGVHDVRQADAGTLEREDGAWA